MQTQMNDEEAVAVAPPKQSSTSPGALKEMAKDYITAYKTKLELATAQDQILKSCASGDGLPKRLNLLKDQLREQIAIIKAQPLGQHPSLVKQVAEVERQLAVFDKETALALSTAEQQDMAVVQQEVRDKADDVVAAFSRLDASLEDDASPLGRKLVEISNECDSQPEVARERVKKLVLPSNFNTIEAVIKTMAHLQGTADSTVMPTQDGGDGHEEGEAESKGATVGADGQS